MNTPLTAKIMIVTDNASDAILVKNLLLPEFSHIFTSTDPFMASNDFMRHRPDVLVLAFNALEKSERYYLSLYRLCAEAHSHPHRTLILCNKDEVKKAYELCKKDLFDDYILFWPMTYDSSRLNMSLHFALRELAKVAGSSGTPDKFKPEQPRAQEELGVAALATDKSAEAVILVVDDDKFQHKLVGKILLEKNYQLVYASSGIEALKIIRNTLPDLVLMDVMMPDMDGIETTRHLKAEPQLARVPVIMITGKSEGQVVIDSLKAGATDFVVKPFDRATLIDKIARALAVKAGK